ncbi:tyrosine-type recombinase/integrase [Sinimarinibacterium flocculans]|uniref:Integrase n=1 Tax=Sinimarinibacterium flocculans TaxID=985250 RepID=A0A318E7L9_9GAMM|nr:integrase arm-type DNA-binding domain-containing protein [Sinimarinibacterium flocculans]PXV67687.1 integrase [Sinimarinibacterium flocculans]
MKLTDTLIRNAKPKGKPYKLPRELGLFLLVNPNGAKWWRFAYTSGGKEQLLSLGVYPDVSLSLARQRRDEARKLLAEGVNPSEHRREVREAAKIAAQHTFGAIAEMWFAAEIDNKSETYRASVRRTLDRDILPYVGKRAIREISARELLVVLNRIKERGAEETSRRARVNIGQVFRYAIREAMAENDPTLALRGERRRTPKRNFAAFTDPADVSRLMQAIYGYRGTPEIRAALKLSAMLFQRPGEIRRMQWSEIDFDAAQWRYVVSKTNTPHIVPLSAQALEVLRDLQPLTDRGLSLQPNAPRYVFPSPRSRLRPMSENGVRQALRNMGFTNDEMTAHGFRAMARSLLAEQGWKPEAIERQLAHKASGPLGAAYDRAAYLNERKAMMQAWADYLDTLRTRVNVVPLRAA